MLKRNVFNGYKDEAYPPQPTKGRIFWRKCMLWQMVRFFVLNLKIMRIVVGGHS